MATPFGPLPDTPPRVNYRIQVNQAGQRALRPFYPPAFVEVKKQVRARAGGRCECCREIAEGSVYISRDGQLRVQGSLQISHRNHRPHDIRLINLWALCNRCHGFWDKPHRESLGTLTSGCARTLTQARLNTIHSRMRDRLSEHAGIAPCLVITPGELEMLAATVLWNEGELLEEDLAARLIAMSGAPLGQAWVLSELRGYILEHLRMRGLARRKGAATWVYSLPFPFASEEQPEVNQ